MKSQAILTGEVEGDKLLEKEIEMGLLLYLLLFSYLSVDAGVRSGGEALVIEYSADDPVREVVFYYSRDGKDYYPIGLRENTELKDPFEGKFYWVFPKGKWEGGYIKVVARDQRGDVEGKVIDGRNLGVVSTGSGEMGRDENVSTSSHTLKTPKRETSGDPYAWRMVGYDVQHTGYYPYPLYPPLELKWTYTGEEARFDMISGSAGNNLLYLPGGTLDEDWERLREILAMDIETGKVVWKRTLTSNVWCAALSPGDSLLFVGTSIEPSLTQPTFFCLDAHTGEIKWSKFLFTVGNGILPVDSLIYIQSVQGFLYAFNVRGEEIWVDTAISPWVGTGRIPVYYEGKVYIGGENSALLALNALTGDTIWVFQTPSYIYQDPTVYNGKVYIFSQEYPDGILYALNAETGELVWEKHGFSPAPALPISAFDNKLYFIQGAREEDSVYTKVYCLDAQTGEEFWSKRDIGGDGMVRVVISSNEILWIPSQKYLFALSLDTGEILYRTDIFEHSWPTWYWPVLYRDYIIVSHSSEIYVFKEQKNDHSYVCLSVYPNPFDESIIFWIKKRGQVTLEIYDVAGRLVKSIYRGEVEGDSLRVIWNGKDRKGREIPSGVYFVVLKEGANLLASQKVVYLKRR